jgi:MinD superfamily P-loop ATPase
MDLFTFRPIGIISTPFTESKGTPIQPKAAEGIAGTVKVFPEFCEGLQDLSNGKRRMSDIKELVVLSGKGGTGKTSIVGALAALAPAKVLCDADVDAADLHLILNPQVQEKHDFVAGHKAAIDPEQCIQCGECLNWCRFGAISDSLVINPLLCEGCGVCYYLCPVQAVQFPDNHCGEWYLSTTRFGPMVHARLGIAEENSGKLVTLVRNEARRLAEEQGRSYILTDGPPGIGCPAISSLGGATAVLLVAEPTVSGHHDLERVAALADHFSVPVLCW